LDLHDPFYGCEVEPEAPEGELREEQARVLALRAAALLGPQVARAAGKRRVNKAAPRRWLISPLHAEALHAVAKLRRVAAAPSIADVEEAAEAEPAAGAADTAAPKQAKGVKRPRRAPFRWTADLLQRTLELIGANPMDCIRTTGESIYARLGAGGRVGGGGEVPLGATHIGTIIRAWRTAIACVPSHRPSHSFLLVPPAR